MSRQSVMDCVRNSTLVANLFPGGVIAAERRGRASLDRLLDAEMPSIARMAPRRAAEFATGRECARYALAQLGLEPTAIPIGADRAPIWPNGVVGSISHTEDYCVAVVAPTRGYVGLGVDVERIDDVAACDARLMLRAEELHELPRQPARRLEQLAAVFCAKEAFYKCQQPLTRSWLDYQDVSVHFHADTFRIVVHAQSHTPCARLPRVCGKFLRYGTLLLAGVALGGVCEPAGRNGAPSLHHPRDS